MEKSDLWTVQENNLVTLFCILQLIHLPETACKFLQSLEMLNIKKKTKKIKIEFNIKNKN